MSTAAGPLRRDSASEVDGLTIQATSQLLQVPAPTLRSWERRYGIPVVSRSRGGHRRFTPEQLQDVRRMRDEIARGRPAAEAAAIVRAHQTVSASRPLVDEFLQAAHGLRPDGVCSALDRARDSLGLDRAVDEVLLPAMREIGRWWETGRCDVAHEHLATTTVSGWLTRTVRRAPSPLREGTIILSCGPRDYHTLGLESIGVLLNDRGWDCRLLGARVPTQALVTAIEATSATAAIMVSHLSVGRRAAVEALRAARLTRTRLFYAGDAFVSRQARVGVPGDYLGDNLSQAADLITRECS